MADGVHKPGMPLTKLFKLYGRDALLLPDIIELLSQDLCLTSITSIIQKALSILQSGYLVCKIRWKLCWHSFDAESDMIGCRKKHLQAPQGGRLCDVSLPMVQDAK
ncbi:hypothetical protein CVIRNUC_009901 [Coccomyxa viridis]|uniref:Uncharacterized protein n=1 Tax=Coccomyxa viridis TaxID=1274662 RepID=A0AAV1IKF2_9CHLO|nr:hypothetical protein CVIRNUC_009901 [Coccomyxa viridis]